MGRHDRGLTLRAIFQPALAATRAAAIGAAVSVAALLSCVRSVNRPDVIAPSDRPLGTQGVLPGAPGVPYAKKTREQRMEFMGLTFHPRMRELFLADDAVKYDKFRCQTCHGEDMEARAFAMPATLHPLGAADPVAAGRARDDAATRFMVEKVMPLTVALLGEGDPELRARIDCGSCHAKE